MDILHSEYSEVQAVKELWPLRERAACPNWVNLCRTYVVGREIVLFKAIMPVKARHRELGTPLCLAFGKTCDSPTVETYSLVYGIVDGCPCLHSESPDLDRVLNALQQSRAAIAARVWLRACFP